MSIVKGKGVVSMINKRQKRNRKILYNTFLFTFFQFIMCAFEFVGRIENEIKIDMNFIIVFLVNFIIFIVSALICDYVKIDIDKI